MYQIRFHKLSMSICQADIHTPRKCNELTAIYTLYDVDRRFEFRFGRIFIGQSYCIYRAQLAFCRHARRFSQNESFVITRKAVNTLCLGLTRASASINVVFGIKSRNVERNCTPSIITVPRSTTTKKVSFATNNVLLARTRWHMKDDRNEALYILRWQIAIAHVTSRLSRNCACVHACVLGEHAWLNERNLDRVFQRGETAECHSNISHRCAWAAELASLCHS